MQKFHIYLFVIGLNIVTSTLQPTQQSRAENTEASVYADKFQGKKTASGDRFDQSEHTAASKTLPLGSKAIVTNKKTGKSTEVTITDRGPYVKGRNLDLSKAAAKSIGMHENGTAPVEVKKSADNS